MANPSVLETIQGTYASDEFCKKVILSAPSTTRISTSNGLWYIGDCLLIPHAGMICEDLFHLAHDTAGHFRADKSYATLQYTYYWPNMLHNLEKAYIPLCTECLHNKSATTKPSGPLHLLPIPNRWGDSVTIDFIGPLPLNEHYNCILSMTDRLGYDIQIIPTCIDITVEDPTLLFFNHWYCENGLPKDIVSDHDKLFLSKFWVELHKSTGVKMKLLSSYHP